MSFILISVIHLCEAKKLRHMRSFTSQLKACFKKGFTDFETPEISFQEDIIKERFSTSYYLSANVTHAGKVGKKRKMLSLFDN